MDWKILVAVVVGLLIFGLVQLCSDDEPNYDEIQAQKRAEAEESRDEKKAEESRERRENAKAAARESRGERPPEETWALETEDFRALFSSRGGALRSFSMNTSTHPQYTEAPRNWETGERDEDSAEMVPVDLVSTNVERFEWAAPLRFHVHQGLDALLPDADYEIVEKDENGITFRCDQPDLPVVIYKKFEIDRDSGPFQIWLTVRVRNRSEKKVQFLAGVVQQGFQHHSETGGGLFSTQPNLLQGICRHNQETYRQPWNSSDMPNIGSPYVGHGKILFAGVETNYFLSAMIPGDDDPVSCYVYALPDANLRERSGEGVARAELRWGEVELEPGESHLFRVKNYLGPKKFELLEATGHDLEEAVDFGWFGPISKILLWLLLAFQSALANWGVAIIALTFCVKVVLMPLTHRSFISADRMKQLKPQVDEINAKYKDDPQAKQKETMALYKRNKVSPFGGCLPTLLQMPIWIALFRTLRASPELYHAEFFGWIRDLSSPDPYFVTPIVMGALMFLQQRITPMTGDSTQAKMMMYFMPIMFTVMMLFLPSGLTLYILVNTVLSITHQTVVHRLRAKKGPQPGAPARRTRSES